MVVQGAQIGIVTIDPGNFMDEVTGVKEPVLIACLSSHDQRNSDMGEMRKLAEHFNDALRVVTATKESLGGLGQMLKVTGTPTFLLYNNGVEVGRLLGRWDEFLLADFIMQMIFADQ
jgi:hypothetical protein